MHHCRPRFGSRLLLWAIATGSLAMGAACTSSNPPPKPIPCSDHSDCDGESVCVDGLCSLDALFCGPQDACPSGLSCCGGRCRTEQCCLVDYECSGGFCNQGICVADAERPTCSQQEPCASGRCLLSLPEPKCVECIIAEDCPSEEHVCSPTHQCVPEVLAGCSPSSCASEGLICAPEQGACRPCGSQFECGDRVCQDGTCQACQTNPQCGVGRACVDGRCAAEEGTPCLTNADCGDRVCVESGSGKICSACFVSAECGPESTCNSTTGYCTSSTLECSTDIQCAPPTSVCVASECIAGCATSGCAGGQQCNPSTGRCVLISAGADALGDDCSNHTNCQSGVCWALHTNNGPTAFCSHACARSTDCPSGFTCVSLGDGALCVAHSRLPAGSRDGSPGAACSADFFDTSCKSQWCNKAANSCYETCGRDSHCLSASQRCITRPTGEHNVSFAQVCGAPAGALAAGQECGSDSQCQSGFCMQTPDSTMPPRCAQPCCTPADCAPAASVCKPVDYWSGLRENLADPYGYEKACLWREYQGSKELGAECNNDGECKSEICVQGASGVARCTQTCCTSQDCAGFSWAPVCRPGFGSALLTHDSSNIPYSLGRWAIGAIIYSTMARSPICMPK